VGDPGAVVAGGLSTGRLDLSGVTGLVDPLSDASPGRGTAADGRELLAGAVVLSAFLGELEGEAVDGGLQLGFPRGLHGSVVLLAWADSRHHDVAARAKDIPENTVGAGDPRVATQGVLVVAAVRAGHHPRQQRFHRRA
jgi:hypothetical protein